MKMLAAILALTIVSLNAQDQAEMDFSSLKLKHGLTTEQAKEVVKHMEKGNMNEKAAVFLARGSFVNVTCIRLEANRLSCDDGEYTKTANTVDGLRKKVEKSFESYQDKKALSHRKSKINR